MHTSKIWSHPQSSEIAAMKAHPTYHPMLRHQRPQSNPQPSASRLVPRCSASGRPPHILTEEESRRTEPPAAGKV